MKEPLSSQKEEEALVARVQDGFHAVEDSVEASLRRIRERDAELKMMKESMVLIREQLEVFQRHMSPMNLKYGPSESIQIPGSWTPVPKQSLWKPFTLGFGALAFVLAVLLSLLAG